MNQPDAEALGDLPERSGHARVARIYDRIAPIYDVLDAVYEHSWKRDLRAHAFARARGRILDVGVGTGCNMPFYPKGADVVGIDLSRAMLDRAAERAAEHGQQVRLLEMNLLELELEDHAFDTVAATFVLLCLPEELQLPALRELRRVLAPDGRFVILDYKLSERPGMRFLSRCLGPWLKWAFGGSFEARTADYVEAAGFEVIERRSFRYDSVVLLTLKPRQP